MGSVLGRKGGRGWEGVGSVREEGRGEGVGGCGEYVREEGGMRG